MKTFRELCDNKPSRALQAMLDGLEAMENRSDFVIRMSTFGYALLNVCYGCAATCAVQQLAGYVFTPDDYKRDGDTTYMQSQSIKADTLDLERFEFAINDFRLGSPNRLLNYFEVPLIAEVKTLMGDDFAMSSDNYRNHFPKVREIIEVLKRAGK